MAGVLYSPIKSIQQRRESIKTNIFQVLKKEDANVQLGGTIALLKAQSSQTMEFCAREASQIFGGLSYPKYQYSFV
jgi:hypothetical protein